MDRRHFMQHVAGASAVMLPSTSFIQNLRAAETNLKKANKSLIIFWMGGGPMAEDFVPFTIVSNEVAHIFDNAQDWHPNLLKHFDAFSGINHTDFLWSSHNNRAIQWNCLSQSKLGIACAWW